MTELTDDARVALEKDIAAQLSKLVFCDTHPPTGYPIEGVEIWTAIVRAAIVDKGFNAELGQLGLRARALLIEAAQKNRGCPGEEPLKSPETARTKH